MKSIKAKRAYLVLADATVFIGYSMGAVGQTIGEVVFNTCSASYQSILSDPTYYGQIIAQTYPLVGNRGAENEDNNTRITANGYIAREWCDTPSDIQGGMTLDEYLKAHNIVGIYGIDTRRLTRTLRDKGYFNGAITQSLNDFDNLIKKIKSYSIHGAVSSVTVKEPVVLKTEDSIYNVVIIDYGFPRTLQDSFIKRKCRLNIVPAHTSPEEILKLNPEGIVFSNGPGDPDDDPALIKNIKVLLSKKIPSFGMGVGHQMMVLACGGLVEKMPKGHRGSNQPVRICGTDKVMVTMQNHGYDVAQGSLHEDVARIMLTNVNDNSIEGLYYTAFPGLSIQFTPNDTSPNSETAWVYDEFIRLMKEGKSNE
ncbi:MAG: carbamoyl phosphate synthase small subunit [Clostridiales bacterium]|nr:carbamoyl phosphate synthase small subunit [Clostridiales bacterium]